KKLLRSQTSGLVRRYRVRPMPFLGTRLERMSPTEQIEDDAQPPQWFIFDGDVRHLGFKARDLRTTPLTERSTQALTGHPMIFSEGQLSHLLPGSLSGPEARAHLLIELVFSVAANGDLENISVAESNAPNKLDRMLVSALKKMRYRPRLVNGVPVRQDGVRIVQTFAETDTSL
ncbi:MAG: energy transducer TonB, partial [Pseudomonadales bacterium]